MGENIFQQKIKNPDAAMIFILKVETPYEMAVLKIMIKPQIRIIRTNRPSWLGLEKSMIKRWINGHDLIFEHYILLRFFMD